MRSAANTIEELLKKSSDNFTRAERQVAHLILDNYPVSGLGSITTIAQNADVSTPTVARMVQKLGFKGFPEFQAELRSELEAKISNPISKHDTWTENAPESHIINRFTEAVFENIQQSMKFLDIETFDNSCKLLGDSDRSIYIVGGRITRAMASYFFLHMQIIRSGVTHVEAISNAWPHYLLDIKQGDVLVIFDVRRYETSTLKLAEMAAEKGAEIILFTDQWKSPVSKYATHHFCNSITVPSAWDSSVTTLLLLEALIASLQEEHWTETKSRIQDLENMFDQTKFFRKFT
ncbi:MAG: MurR/RpiR family transcriptional regulator [Methyloligellaceae bacterium]